MATRTFTPEIARFADMNRPGVAWVIQPDPIMHSGHRGRSRSRRRSRALMADTTEIIAVACDIPEALRMSSDPTYEALLDARDQGDPDGFSAVQGYVWAVWVAWAAAARSLGLDPIHGRDAAAVDEMRLRMLIGADDEAEEAIYEAYQEALSAVWAATVMPSDPPEVWLADCIPF